MRPNVLLLITDQQSRLAQSAAGTGWVCTPHLDDLSASGVRFTRGYCAAPVCGPSRASLATGRPPHQTGLIVNRMPWPSHVPEICGRFLGAGYDVGWAGAWLPGASPRTSDDGPRFERLVPDLPTRMGCECDGPIASAASAYLERGHERPFFLGVPLVNPHDICYWVMDRLPESDPQGELPPLPDNFEPAPDEPDFIRRCRERTHYGPENTWTRDWDEDHWRRYLREYGALTQRVDGEVGRILQALADAGLERDTVVLYTSDHGEGMAARRWVVKLMLWESVVSVPLTLSWPGVIPAGQTRDQLASGIDVLPTLCDYAGVAVPEGVVGTSLRGVVEDDSAPGRDYVVGELHPDAEDLDVAARIVVSRRCKYVAFSQGRRREMLFDLEADPGETRDLATEPGWQEEVARHRRWLEDWAAETQDPFPAGSQG